MNNKLTITWKPDVMVDSKYIYKDLTQYRGGLTARSERETFNNIKTIAAANRILARRNKEQILFASFRDQTTDNKFKEI